MIATQQPMTYEWDSGYNTHSRLDDPDRGVGRDIAGPLTQYRPGRYATACIGGRSGVSRNIDFLPVPKGRGFFSLSGSDERNRTTLKMRSEAHSNGGSHNPDYGKVHASQIFSTNVE